jgi:hypothetical protein
MQRIDTKHMTAMVCAQRLAMFRRKAIAASKS